METICRSLHVEITTRVRRCVVCGCTDADCRQCIKRTGEPCEWDPIWKHDVCTACSHVYFACRMAAPYAEAFLALMTDRAEIVRARDFAVRLGDMPRVKLIEVRLKELDEGKPNRKGKS